MLTIRVLTELQKGDALASEVARAIGESRQTVAGTMTQLCKTGCAEVVGHKTITTPHLHTAHIYRFVRMPGKSGGRRRGSRNGEERFPRRTAHAGSGQIAGRITIPQYRWGSTRQW